MMTLKPKSVTAALGKTKTLDSGAAARGIAEHREHDRAVRSIALVTQAQRDAQRMTRRLLTILGVAAVIANVVLMFMLFGP